MAKSRNEFDSLYKWNTKDLYKSDEDALKDIDYILNNLDKITKFKNHILDSASNLLNLLEIDTEISKVLERLYIYGHINNDADTTNTYYQELFGKIKNVYTKYLEATSYIVPELLSKDYKVIEKYIKEESKLKEYERNLKDIFRVKKHILSTEVEEVLSNYAKLMDSPEEVMSSLTDSDFKFDSIIVDGKSVELTESNYSIYIRHNDREVRKQAFKSLYKTYSNFKNTLATILRNEIEKNVSSAKVRKYKNSLNASLFHNEIDESVYYNLIKSIHNNLDVLYKYWNLKKKILKIDDFHLYDTYTSLEVDNEKKYTFEEAKDIVLEAIKPLGDTYQKDFKESFNGWIDSCNNSGKRGGAYCTSCYSVHPYVLMSFEGTLNDVSTLIHELGHAMHYYYACKNQKYQDYNYSIFVAEVASQVNEILLSRYLLEHSKNKKEKLLIIDDLLQKYKASIFRQTMFAEFELFMYEYTENGGVLTYNVMCDKYLELNKLYFGNDVIIDDEIKYEWERIPHFYMNFYVYQYATGFAASVYLANEIFNGNKKVRDNYLEFLKLGCTKNPVDSLKVAGVDMNREEVYDNAIKFMNELINEYEELIGSEENE